MRASSGFDSAIILTASLLDKNEFASGSFPVLLATRLTSSFIIVLNACDNSGDIFDEEFVPLPVSASVFAAVSVPAAVSVEAVLARGALCVVVFLL